MAKQTDPQLSAAAWNFLVAAAANEGLRQAASLTPIPFRDTVLGRLERIADRLARGADDVASQLIRRLQDEAGRLAYRTRKDLTGYDPDGLSGPAMGETDLFIYNYRAAGQDIVSEPQSKFIAALGTDIASGGLLIEEACRVVTRAALEAQPDFSPVSPPL